jgi:hypothetical protein
MDFILMILALMLVLAAVWWWDDHRHVQLAEYGVGNVQRVLKWETEAQREAIWQRGWLTRAQWRAMNRRQLAAINAELDRRGVKQGASE